MKHLLAVIATVVTAALLVPTAATPSTSQTRPMAGVCKTVPVQTGPAISVTGTCLMTHLGRTQLENSHLAIPTGPPVNGVLPIALVGGQGTYTAANGDELTFVFGGAGDVTLATGLVQFQGTTTYMGGTGRFAEASGSASFRGEAKGASGWYVETGSITY